MLLCQKQAIGGLGMHWKDGCFLAALSWGVGNAVASQWFPVSGPEIDASPSATVEIDLETIHLGGRTSDGVVRVSLSEPKLHGAGFRYQSFIATAQFDCQRRVLTLTSAAFFSDSEGGGLRVGADSSAREAGMPPWLLDDIPEHARRALLRASCANAPAS